MPDRQTKTNEKTFRCPKCGSQDNAIRRGSFALVIIAVFASIGGAIYVQQRFFNADTPGLGALVGFLSAPLWVWLSHVVFPQRWVCNQCRFQADEFPFGSADAGQIQNATLTSSSPLTQRVSERSNTTRPSVADADRAVNEAMPNRDGDESVNQTFDEVPPDDRLKSRSPLLDPQSAINRGVHRGWQIGIVAGPLVGLAGGIIVSAWERDASEALFGFVPGGSWRESFLARPREPSSER